MGRCRLAWEGFGVSCDIDTLKVGGGVWVFMPLIISTISSIVVDFCHPSLSTFAQVICLSRGINSFIEHDRRVGEQASDRDTPSH